MAPRHQPAPSVSTASSSLLSASAADATAFTDDDPGSIAITEDSPDSVAVTEALTEDSPSARPAATPIALDDPATMSPRAIAAELQHYGVSAPSLEDRQGLEKALAKARLQNTSSPKGGSPKGNSPGKAAPQLTPRRRSRPNEGLGEHAQRQYDQKAKLLSVSQLTPDAMPGIPGMRIQSNGTLEPSSAPSPGRVVTSHASPQLPATHIPLMGGNKIPPPILTVIRSGADPSMKAINLDNKPLGDVEVKKLADALGRNRTVEFLSLRNCNVGDAGAAKLGDMLSKNGTLSELHLDSNSIGAEGAAALSTALITNESLAALTLNDNPAMGDKGVSYLVGALEHNATLRTLAVHNTGASKGRLAQIDDLLRDRQADEVDANFEGLLERLKDDDFRVTGIDLSGRRIGDKGAVRLAEALADNTMVRQLWLRGCNVGDEGAKALASCLEQNMAVVDLFLGNNSVGDEGLTAISDALALSNLTLVSLELDDNNVGEAGIDAFLRALEKNSSLLVASFENNPFSGTTKMQKIENALREKRDGLNLVSFVVDPDGGGSTVGGATVESGVVNMSVCSSYMPSTYRRAGFSSVAGNNKSDDLRKSGETHRYSVYHREGQPPNPPPKAKESPPASITFSKSTSSSKSPKRSHSSSKSPRRSRSSSKSPRRARSSSGESPKTEPSAMRPQPVAQPKPKAVAPPKPPLPKPAPKARPSSPPPFARAHAKSTPYSRAHVPVPLKAQALETITERSTATSVSESPQRVTGAFASDMNLVTEGTHGTSLTTPLIGKRKDAASVGHATITESIANPETQRNFDATLQKLSRRVEMMTRINRFAAAHQRARHFCFWFVPVAVCLGLSILLSLACALSAGDDSRRNLSLAVGFFASSAFGLHLIHARFKWSSRAELHRSAEVELTQVAFRLDTLAKYEGNGLTAGAHSTKSRPNAIRDLYRIDVYLQAMQRCTPEAPASINEVFFLLASRLEGICQKYPHAVKLRSAYAFYDEDPNNSENPVPVEMQIDALDLLGREIQSYFLYPLFMPNAKEVVSRTIDIFFAKPDAPSLGMSKTKAKPTAADLGPDSDPKILYKNYLNECKAIGIEPHASVKDTLTNEENTNLGKQLLVLGSGDATLGPGGCRALVNAMIGGKADASTSGHTPYTAAKELRICRSNINDAGARALSSLLMATAHQLSPDLQPWQLEYLELSDNNIGKDGCLALGRALCVGMNRTLVTLILDFNPLGSNGVAALCKGLSTNSTLKKLSLKHCSIDDEGGRPIGDMLRFKRLAVISLDLTSNSLGGNGLIDICQGLKENTCLKTFRFGDNALGHTDVDLQALEALATVLASHPAIVGVDLLHNRIGSKGGSLLLPALQANKQLTEFKVDTSLDEELFKALFRSSAASKKGKAKKGKAKKKK
ncbi:hypothetical protein ACHAXT_006962 [Thalassiosira profunda]